MKHQLLEQFKQSLDNASQEELGRLQKSVSDASSHASTIDMMSTLAANAPPEAPNDVSPKTNQPPPKKARKTNLPPPNKAKGKRKSPKIKQEEDAFFNAGACH